MKLKECPGTGHALPHTGQDDGTKAVIHTGTYSAIHAGIYDAKHAGIYSAKRGASVSLVAALVLLFAFMITGCTPIKQDNADRISRPKNMTAPVTGTWRLENLLKEDADGAGDVNDPLTGEIISFSTDSMTYAGNRYENIGYKIKRVGTEEYFLHKSTRLSGETSRFGSEIFIITVYSDENYILEFIKSHKGEIIAVIDDRYYNMKQVSDSYSDRLYAYDEEPEQAAGIAAETSEKAPSSGLLLGVRIPEQTNDGLGDYSYGTYWISSVERSIRPVLYARNIYLPRMDGFWKMRVVKKLGPEGVEDVLVAAKVSGIETDVGLEALDNIPGRMETRNRKAIIYVGNDYACIENIYYAAPDSTGKPGVEKTLRTLPVDNLAHVDGIEITDLAGENGALAMKNAISDILEKSGINGMAIVNSESAEKNFALFRKTGHWFFKGRLNLNQQEPLPYVDFNINLIPPSNMVAYDVLQVPWTEMKDKLPHAIDIYTSPNKDIAVVLTRSEIYVYSIHEKRLSDEPLGKYPLENGSSVIMAEWCMGRYVAAWEKSFVRNNETIQVENILK
ncbi:MAG: hypothetical protein ACM3XR_05695 [Bacillota bacterium]